MSSKTTIEVNGIRYDAITGAVIGKSTDPPVKSGRNIDGFFRERVKPAHHSVHHAAHETAKPAHKPDLTASRAVNHAKAHAPHITARAHNRAEVAAPHKPKTSHIAVAVNHTKHRTAQSSKTLRREGVRRPEPSFHKQAHPQGALQRGAPSLIATKASVANLNTERLIRAQKTPLSPLVAHHGSQPYTVQTIVTPLAVQPVPTKPEEHVPQGAPAPAPSSKPATGDNRPSDKIFEQALMSATHFVDTRAHVKHFRRQTKRHLASMAAGTLALVVIAGFAAYQNTPGLQFKVASLQAGVSTSMPNLKAAGFAYENARALGGKLTVGFSNDGGTYNLTQETTNFSSSDMIKNVGGNLRNGHPNYVTVQAGDTPVYRFDNTSATWIKNGTWYSVSGNAALSDDQVKSLVKNV